MSLILVNEVSLFISCSSEVFNANTPAISPSITGEKRALDYYKTFCHHIHHIRLCTVTHTFEASLAYLALKLTVIP